MFSVFAAAPSVAPSTPFFFFFFFNDTATTEIYTLSLHDALPICRRRNEQLGQRGRAEPGSNGGTPCPRPRGENRADARARSEEHTSELQSPCNLVCRLLLEKKKSDPMLRRSRKLLQ